MVQTLQAQNITLRDLINKFSIELVDQPQFFLEWQENLPDLSDLEKNFLDRVREGFLNLVTYPPLLEKSIQLAVISPIFFLAGFFLPPFHIRAEKSIEIEVEDEDEIIRGQLDILLLKQDFWVMVIESKKASFSIEEGLGQLLSYMLASPHPEKPGFGLITSGSEFIFVKLVQAYVPQYGTSKLFGIRSREDFYQVYRILKHISQL